MNFKYRKVVGKNNADQKTWMTPLANLSSKSHCPKICWLPTYKQKHLKLINLVAYSLLNAQKLRFSNVVFL
jgi:hypothetical protein